ncbi:MAG TPA: FAD-binding oxidoreductase [Pseudonocardiaceae bacterium]|jgi:glycolate oxidase|nr:FAD-binding oxidoreductase [Pseudonocardiaceae bacterium]
MAKATAERLADELAGIVGPGQVLAGDAISEDYQHDEALTAIPARPGHVVRPATAEQVAEIVALAAAERIPVTARGAGSGLSGAAVPVEGGIVVSFERMNAVLEIDTVNHVAVVQPGVRLFELDARTAEVGLTYPVYPGELSASLGGNVSTNAGGMRAVRYGVTRNHVLGLQAVLGTGELIRTGGRISKVSTGYDLTQLIIGSEGTLALVTEAILKLHPRLAHTRTVLAPFAELDGVVRAVPRIVASGLAPNILEYIDALTMAAITYTTELSLGVPDEVRDATQAYLVVSLENTATDRVDGDVEQLGELLGDLGATDVYVLDGTAAHKLIEAREKAFWTAKAAGANDIVDVVVPRGAMPEFLATARRLAQDSGSGVAGCGHAGDGNVHLAVFQADPEIRHRLLRDMFAAGMALGGAISGEHGIGTEKKPYFLELADPAQLALLRRIKQSFDPAGILNPNVMLGTEENA